MKIYTEITEITKCIQKINTLIEKLDADYGFDDFGIDWTTAEFVSLDNEDIERFKNIKGVTDDYFVDQWTGYCEDDLHGKLYFKTDVPGQYVKVYCDFY